MLLLLTENILNIAKCARKDTESEYPQSNSYLGSKCVVLGHTEMNALGLSVFC